MPLQDFRNIHAHINVRNAAEYLAAHNAAAQRTRRPIRNAMRNISAHVNHGRWLASCECGAGMSVDLTASIARCFECGLVYDVTLPRVIDRNEIERLLMLRPNENRNWVPGESIDDLRADNISHGVGV